MSKLQRVKSCWIFLSPQRLFRGIHWYVWILKSEIVFHFMWKFCDLKYHLVKIKFQIIQCEIIVCILFILCATWQVWVFIFFSEYFSPVNKLSNSDDNDLLLLCFNAKAISLTMSFGTIQFNCEFHFCQSFCCLENLWNFSMLLFIFVSKRSLYSLSILKLLKSTFGILYSQFRNLQCCSLYVVGDNLAIIVSCAQGEITLRFGYSAILNQGD